MLGVVLADSLSRGRQVSFIIVQAEPFDFPFDTLRLSGLSSWFHTNANRSMYFQPLICSGEERL